MPGDIDPKLLGRLAATLEENGTALKTIQATQTQAAGERSANKSSTESAHARLKTLEHTVNGNGGDGLKTKIRLLEQDLKVTKAELDKLEKWKDSLGDKQIAELQQEKKDGKERGLQIWLAVAALLIAIGSMVGSCGPQWFKAWGPDKGGISGSR